MCADEISTFVKDWGVLMKSLSGPLKNQRIDGKFNDVLAFLGRGVRLEILALLADGSRNVTSLADELELSISLISNHLCLMAEQGLVTVKKNKRMHIYRMSEDLIAVRTTFGAHLLLATDDGGWALLHLPHCKTSAKKRLPTIQDMHTLAELIPNGHSTEENNSTSA